MSGNPVAIEKGFWFVSTPQLDDEESSWQFGSSTSSLSYSQYIVVDKRSKLGVKYPNVGKGCGRSVDAEQLRWDLVACDEGSAVLSCAEKSVDYHANVRHQKALQGDPKKLGGPHNSISPQRKRYDFSHVHYGNHLCSVVSPPCPAQSDKEQQVSSQCFQFSPQPSEVNLQNQPHKLLQGSLQQRQAAAAERREAAAEQPEKLGEALCHSQTRARNAEKLATHVLIEKEKLSNLLFREANTCRTYKERAYLLELENLRLKAHAEHATEASPAYRNLSELSTCCKFYQKGMSKGSGSSLSGTVGLAFALGLSCASAAFMIGCCMGLFGVPPIISSAPVLF